MQEPDLRGMPRVPIGVPRGARASVEGRLVLQDAEEGPGGERGVLAEVDPGGADREAAGHGARQSDGSALVPALHLRFK